MTITASFFAGGLYLIAEMRGTNKKDWPMLGFLIGPFAIPFVFYSKRTKV